MTHHTEILNYIGCKLHLQTYLEIGVFNPDHNFDSILVPAKIGVDPDPEVKPARTGLLLRLTSDAFFTIARAYKMLVDLTWIDGLHHEEQVMRDIMNAWDVTRPGGIIAIHDTNPPTVDTTCIPRGKQREWCGDVYKAICRLIYPCAGPYFFTVNFDYGVTLIRKPVPYRNDGSQLVEFADLPDLDWRQFDSERAAFLNLQTIEESLEIIDTWT